jgi:outer membrane protein insertion porin family
LNWDFGAARPRQRDISDKNAFLTWHEGRERHVLTFNLLFLMTLKRILTKTLAATAAGIILLANAGVRAQSVKAESAASQAAPTIDAQQVSQLEGQNVVEVRVVGESGEVLVKDIPELPLLAGHPYDSEVVRTSLRKLYATGDYSDLRAEVANVTGGIRVDFVAQQNFFIGVIRIEGLIDPPSDSAAYSALRLTVGTQFRESDLTDAVAGLEEALALEGFYQAKVTAERAPDASTRRMNLTFRVTPGQRARIGAITLHNLTAYPDTEILSRAKLKSGQLVLSKTLEHGGDRLRAFLKKNDYLGARATLRRGTNDAATNLLPLTIETVTGSRVRVEITGAKMSAKELRKRVPVFAEGAVDPDLLAEGERNLRDYFERQGYFEVEVDYKSTEPPPADENKAEKKDEAKKDTLTPAEQVITYTIDRGRHLRMAGVSFDGDQYFHGSQLQTQMSIQPASFDFPGRYSRRLLDGDMNALKNLYHANGFLDVAVTNEIEQDYKGKKGDLFVHFHVKEGSQTLVDTLTVEGTKALSKQTILSKIASSAGEPYSDFNVVSDRDNILALYYNEGFPDAQFKATLVNVPAAAQGADVKTVPETKPNVLATAHPRVALTYQIDEGPQVKVSGVFIGGYNKTRRGVIAREVKIKQGEPLREGDVIETQRRLYNLGIFTRVTLAPQNPTGTDPDKAVDVIVEEAKRYTIAYGGGVEVQRLGGSGPDSTSFEVAPLVTFEISKANVTGRADTISFKIRASTLQGRALLSYTAPNVFAKPSLIFQTTFFADKSRDVTTFTSTRYESTIQLEHKISRTSELFYRYTFRKVLVDAASLMIAPEQIPLFSQPDLVSEFGVSWTREHRDNPADATHGNYNSVDFSLAGKQIGSSASFARLFLQNSSYYTLSKWLVLARGTRFGVQQTLGNTLSADIPLPERFFAGGGTSLRGFGFNQAGPRDPVTGFPVGGQAMLVFNQELRFPLRLPRIGTKLGGAIFYDVGNVFSSVETITLHSAPSLASQESGQLSYLSHTVGFGFRYNTPVGPVRVDLSYQINPAQFISSCTIGTPGCSPTGTLLTRLPHFQLFFNLGDVF